MTCSSGEPLLPAGLAAWGSTCCAKQMQRVDPGRQLRTPLVWFRGKRGSRSRRLRQQLLPKPRTFGHPTAQVDFSVSPAEAQQMASAAAAEQDPALQLRCFVGWLHAADRTLYETPA